MSPEVIALLFAAGFLAGTMNAVAGGGTFVALPALAAVGLPPTVANASSTVALFPGAVASAWAYRRDMVPLEGVSLKGMMAVSLVGGLVGAVLLLVTSEQAFTQIIPWLLLLATLALAAGPRLGPALRRLGLRLGPRGVLAVQFFLGVYGGYFGGAVGLMMMATWTIFSTADLRQMTPLRTLMLAAANGVAVICFAFSGQVAWAGTLAVMAGGIAGGFGGARLGRRLPNWALRALVLIITVATTVRFFLKAYA